MKQLLLLICLTASVMIGHSQIVESRVNRFLSTHSIDTFLVYSTPCSGGIMLDSCQYDEPHFVFFKQNESYYLKRFDYCTTYQSLSIDDTNPLTYYLQHKVVIDTEEVKPPSYIEAIKKKRRKVESTIITLSVSHSCYYQFQLPFTKEPLYKTIDSFDLEFKTFDNGKENMYYAYNQQTKLKALIDLTDLLIKNLEADKKFQSE